MKHTPGPWIARRFGAIHGGELIEYTNGKGQPQVALACCHASISDEERQANVRLIAAAPDLLEALKACMELARLDEVPAEVTQRRYKALIAKAEATSDSGEERK